MGPQKLLYDLALGKGRWECGTCNSLTLSAPDKKYGFQWTSPFVIFSQIIFVLFLVYNS